jgi:chemotaxis signal transduction protein
MAIFTSRRFENRQVHQASRQLVIFQLQGEWLALPIECVYRVIPLGQVYGVSHGQGISLTRYENQEIPVIDIQRRIFGSVSVLLESPESSIHSKEVEPYIPVSVPLEDEDTPQSQSPKQHYLLIIQTSQGELTGIPLESQPSLRRVPESAFAPPPASYLANGTIRCVSALVTLDNNHPSLFLLNPAQIMQDVPVLPGG